MTVIKDLRLKQGLDPDKLAESAGMTIEGFRDLESMDDEIYAAPSIRQITVIARDLGVRPSVLFGGSSERAVSIGELASLIPVHLRRTGKSLTEFEAEAGWKLGSALKTPEEFLEFSGYGLRDLCTSLGLNWFDVLDGMTPITASDPADHPSDPRPR